MIAKKNFVMTFAPFNSEKATINEQEDELHF